MTPVQRAQLVYFPIGAVANDETPFPPIENLIGDVEITGLVAYSFGAQLNATPDGAAVVAAADALALTVRLYMVGSDCVFQDVPYSDFIRQLNAGIGYEFVPFRIDLTKCSVRTNAAIAGPVNAAFLFHYRLLAPR